MGEKNGHNGRLYINHCEKVTEKVFFCKGRFYCKKIIKHKHTCRYVHNK